MQEVDSDFPHLSGVSGGRQHVPAQVCPRGAGDSADEQRRGADRRGGHARQEPLAALAAGQLLSLPCSSLIRSNPELWATIS